MPLRLVATDLDGTIVRSDGTISPRTTKVLNAAVEAGLRVVLVSGRPPRWVLPVAVTTGLRGPAVCANGALIYDPVADRVLEAFLLPPERVEAVVRRLRTALPDVRFAVETGGDIYAADGYHGGWHLDGVVQHRPLEDLQELAAAKLLVYHPSMNSDDLLDHVRREISDLAQVTHSNGRNLVEVSARGVNKATTVAYLAQRWGIDPSEVVAFGDMPNDVELLRWAGRGYAMAGAHPSARAAADDLAPGNDDDGVAVVLEGILAGLPGRS
ncbi:MAG: Cof-type HAD-IIB family hydrolase [Acidothermus sp.]|nr:Cof-type HAD-IIB family hydrolase [Acidothermus sp.]